MTTALRPNKARARLSIALLWTMFVGNIVSLGSGLMQYLLLQRIQAGEVIDPAVFDRNDLRERIIGLLFFGVYLVCAIAFIRWFRRAYYNLHQLVSGLEETEGWAAGAWFVPLLNLYKPLRIMKELFTRTADLVERGLGRPVRPDMSVLNLWWACWVLSSILGQITFRMSMGANDLPSVTNSTIIGMISNLVEIPLCLLALWVVRTYTAMEQHLPGLPREVDRLFPSAEAPC